MYELYVIFLLGKIIEGDYMTKKLSRGKQGVLYRVVSINGTSETNQFLNNIGLFEGDEIMIISKLASNLIINIKDGRFGIDEGIAKLIMVEA